MGQSNRQPLIDTVKVVAAQFIFFHHAALYGPLAQAWHVSFPDWARWWADFGLMAVQVFLVVAGYLAAQTLSRDSALHPILFISRRFERLARPLWFVLFITLCLSFLAKPWLTGDMLPNTPTWPQLVAHIFLLQSALGFDSLSAGVWYPAIDFQLYVIMVWLVLVTQPRRWPWIWPTCVAVLTTLSAWWINRNTQWDASGFYFFAAYGLGALVWWARQGQSGRRLYALSLLGVGGALWFEWRLRLCVASLTSVLLWAALGWQGWGRLDRIFARLNSSTYLFFLLNFPLLILANLFWVAGARRLFDEPSFLITVWVLGLVLADQLQHRVKWLSALVAIKKK